ncbi:hypothetical protein GCM10023310_26180 [Paenibacillus vulneris]
MAVGPSREILSQLKSPGFKVYPSSTTMFIRPGPPLIWAAMNLIILQTNCAKNEVTIWFERSMFYIGKLNKLGEEEQGLVVL